MPDCLLPLQRRDVVEVFGPESLGDAVDDLLASVEQQSLCRWPPRDSTSVFGSLILVYANISVL